MPLWAWLTDRGIKHRAGLPGFDRPVVRYPCGRYGVPSVVKYEIREGPHKGKLVSVPPRWAEYPAPLPEGVGSWALKKEGIGAAYLRVIHDEIRFAELDAIGFWLSREHMGDNEFTDNRRTS